MLISILRQWERVLIQLFTLELLLRVLQLKLLNLEMYYSRTELQKDVATFVLTNIAFLKVTRL